jgi:hypothetical protein
MALLVLLLLSGRVRACFWSELLAGLHRLNQCSSISRRKRAFH